MKKIIALLTAVSTFLTVSSVSVSAEDRGSLIKVTVSPAFTVTVPLSVRVPFNSLETDFGSVILDTARLESDKKVVVTLESDNTLDNTADSSKTIPYSIHDKADGSVFVSAEYLSEGEKTDLTINISQDDWNQAAAGDYEDTVIFHIQYTDR